MTLKLPPWPLWVALQFLTRLPVQLSAMPTQRQQGQSLLWYPVVGLWIGALLIVFALALQDLPSELAAGLLLSVWVFSSGGLHLDGLADSADAWAGGLGDRERSLRIMKDPAAGPSAVVVLVLVLLLKFVSLELLLQEQGIALLLLPLVFARCSILLLFLTTPYVRKLGLGAAMANQQPRNASICVLVLTALLMLLWMPWQAFCALSSCVALFLYLRHLSLQRLGGFTGDVAGAFIELTETIVIISLACGISVLS